MSVPRKCFATVELNADEIPVVVSSHLPEPHNYIGPRGDSLIEL